MQVAGQQILQTDSLPVPTLIKVVDINDEQTWVGVIGNLSTPQLEFFYDEELDPTEGLTTV